MYFNFANIFIIYILQVLYKYVCERQNVVYYSMCFNSAIIYNLYYTSSLQISIRMLEYNTL
jgi:hypothetical protein